MLTLSHGPNEKRIGLPIEALKQGCYLGRAHKQRSVSGIIPLRGSSAFDEPGFFAVIAIFVCKIS